MNIPSRLLQVAYFQALNGNISYGGSNVPVYDVIPPGADYPFILLGSQFVNESNFNTTRQIVDVVMDVDITTGFQGAFGGKSQAYDISDQVVNRIRKTPGTYLSLSGFKILTSTLDSANILQDQDETHILYINKLRFRHIISQE